MQVQRNEGIMKKIMRKTSTLRKHHHRANDSTVTFHFKLHKSTEDFLNESVLISGSIPELGSGNLEKAARMMPFDSSEGRVWKYDLIVPLKELEHSRMNIDGSYEGNPHGNFFTYNYVVKSSDSTLEKFESVPRRGIAKSSLSTTNSLGGEDLIREVSLEHSWADATPRGSIIVPRKMDLPVEMSKNLELKPSNSDPLMGQEQTARLTGKATADMSPSMAPRSSTNQSSRAAPLPSSIPPPIIDRSVSFIDRKEDRQELSKAISSTPNLMDAPVPSTGSAAASPTPSYTSSSPFTIVDNKSKSKGMFSWYKSISRKASSTVLGSTRSERRHTVSGVDAAKQAELAVANVNVKYSDVKPEGSTYGQTRQTRAVSDFGPESLKSMTLPIVEEASTEPTLMDMSAIPTVAGSPMIKQRKELEQDPLTAAVASNLSSSDFFSIPKEESELVNNEMSEDVLLDRIEENTPLLASESSQLQYVDSMASMDLNNNLEDCNSSLSHSDVVDFAEFQEVTNVEYIPESTSVNPVLFGKWHKVGVELKQKIGGDASWSAYLQSRPIRSSSLSSLSVDPILYGKVHRLGLDLKSKINENTSSIEYLNTRRSRSASLPSVDAVISGKMYRVGQEIKSNISDSVSAKDFLNARRAKSAPLRSVDPIISGKMYRVGQEIKNVSQSSSGKDYLISRRARLAPVRSVDPIISGKMYRVGQDLKSKMSSLSAKDYLNIRKVRSAPLRSVDPIISGRMYRIGQDLKSKIHDDVDYKDYLQSRRVLTARTSVDPIYSGRMYQVGKQLKLKVNAGTWRPVRGFNPILSGKLHQVHHELLEKSSMKLEVESLKSDLAEIKPVSLESMPKEILIVDEKTTSVFEEQIEKTLTHRKVHHDEVKEVPAPKSSDIAKVNYHATRDDFMPISHSESMMAESSSASSQSVQAPRSYAPFAFLFLVLLWLFAYTVFFPESMLMEMSPVASTEVAQVYEPMENLLADQKM